MKHLMFNRHGINWMATCSLGANSVCEVYIEKQRTKKRWYQSEYEYFTDFICVPRSLKSLENIIYERLDEKFTETEEESNFRNEFYQLKDVTYIESKSST